MWSHLREAGRSFVERERNWGASAAHYSAVYRDLVPRGAT
jgi:hypothetical protein